MSWPLTRRLVLVSAAAALLEAACSRPASTPAVVRKHHLIRIEGMTFGVIPEGIRVGDAIDWENPDTMEHSATASNGAFDVNLPPGGKAETIIDRAGEINFYCRYHERMTGKLVVLDAAGQPG